MTSLRTKGKSTIVWILMGMLLLGLGGFGVTNFSGGSTTHIGSVGETDVPTDDYLRSINAEIDQVRAQTGRSLTVEQVRALGIPQAVRARLFAGAALEEQARRAGLSVGDEAVLRQLTQAPAFQGAGGQFDQALYEQFLRQQRLSPAAFEDQVRADEARLLIQRAVASGVGAPSTLVDRTVAWLLERRDLSWTELTAAQLAAPVAAPDDETLKAWHAANAARFSAPETRKITYAWLTPEMLADQVQLDEQALRDLYQQRIGEFRQPERRMVERLVFQDQAAAEAAKARLDAGQVTWEALAAERGLQLADIDLGEVSQEALGAAGSAVFALDQPGIVGPVQTDLGPALFSMNAILEPLDVPFEQAAPDLRAEAAADRAKRQIEQQAAQFEDLLAGGATLEDLARETPMKVAQIDYSSATPSQGIAAYQAFRDRAMSATDKDFPQILPLDDGGIFALRLDAVTPPAPIPFDQVRDEVLADWTAAETRRQLKVMADDMRVRLDSAAAPGAAPAQALPTLTVVQGVERGTGIPDTPGDLGTAAFRLAEPGDSAVVEAEGRVFLVRLDRIVPADLAGADAAMVRNGVSARLADSLQNDVLESHARALQAAYGLKLDDRAIAAADARLP